MDELWDGGTITEGWRALELFTDRTQRCRRFLAYINDDPAPASVLVFHGDGGNGKSLLLAHLRERLCKRLHPDNWAYLRELDDEECVAQVAEAADAAPIPVGRLDFAQDPKDGFGALLKLRRDLTGSGLRFPLFDFAVVTYLHRSHQLTDERLPSVLPQEELDVLAALVELFNGVPGIGPLVALLKLGDKRLGAWIQRYRHRRRLDAGQVAALLRMDHETELVHQLPRLFAEDLNAALAEPGAPARVALFFDTHEAFWGHERTLGPDLYFGRDEWLRRLTGALDRPAGAMVVVAGREVPKWAEADRCEVTDLEVYLVGELSDGHALAYLARAGVTDPALRRRLCDDARVGPDQVHPFYLGLGADLVLTAARKGAALTEADLALGPRGGSRRRQIVNRLLRYVDAEVRDAVYAVSACRSFTFEIYRYLGQELDFPTSRAGFAVLTGFSFVRRTDDGGTPRYQVHGLLRRLRLAEADEVGRAADAALERYYRQRVAAGDASAMAEAIYHTNRQEWERGVAEWVTDFAEAMRRSQFDLCQSLRDLRSDLRIETPTWRGLVFAQEAEYLFRLSRYHEARTAYVTAIAAHTAALERAPDDPGRLNNKGLALQGLARLQAMLADYLAAQASYREAIAAYDAALKRVPDDPGRLNNKGNGLRSRADLQATLADYPAAQASYGAAIAAYDAALRLAPNNAYALSNQGEAYEVLGTLRLEIGGNRNDPGLIAAWRSALGLYRRAHGLAPDDAEYHAAVDRVSSPLDDFGL